MAKLDSSIYGCDDNSFASGVAADALGSPKGDYCGIDQPTDSDTTKGSIPTYDLDQTVRFAPKTKK
jgi:hypothetical protein